MTRNKSSRGLTFACGRDYAFSASANHWSGLRARELGGQPPPSGFFTSVIHDVPFMGGSCGRVKTLPVLARSLNPHVSAHPHESGRAENINRLARRNTMPKSTKGASAPAANPIDPHKLCAAIDLLDEAYAISAFMADAINRVIPDTDDALSVHGRVGFHLVMCDMADRIKKASFIVDEYREGVNHD